MENSDINILWALSLISPFLSIICVFLFFKLLKKFDDFKLDMFDYIKENGELRIQLEEVVRKNTKDIRGLKNVTRSKNAREN